MTRIEILGVPVDGQRFDDAVASLVAAASTKRLIRGHFVTVHSLVEATKNPRLREVFGSAGLACTDGMPLVWLARRRGAPAAERCAGPDTMLAVCDRGRELGLRHYFYGGAPGTPEALRDRLTAAYPGLQVVGMASPPFRALTPEEDTAAVEAINAARPDVLWIGLGSPKQDLWAADHADSLTVPTILAVGAAFDFHSGRIRRAPRWMGRVGLEWLFRLAMDPRRLAWRYIRTNTTFAFLLTVDLVRRRFLPAGRAGRGVG